MRNPVPPIREDEALVKERLQREHDGQRKPRLQMLYLLVTRQAQDRREVARLLGVHRNTIGRWLARYAAGGLDALLATYVPAGKPSRSRQRCSLAWRRPSAVPKASPRMRRCGNGCAQTHGVEIKYKTLYTLVRTRFLPNSKCRAPVTQKNPEAIPAFQTTCEERLQEVIPPVNTRPVRVFSQDESRFGLLTIRRRRLTAHGVQPVGPSSMSSSGSMSMARWSPLRATGSSWNCPI